MRFCYILIVTLFVANHAQRHPVTDYNDHFNCIETYTTDGTNWTPSGQWDCCGYNGLGERHCSSETEWEKYEGKYRRCQSLPFTGEDGTRYRTPEEMVGSGYDLCCDSGNPYIDDCGKCKSFYIWDFLNQAQMNATSTLAEDWRTEYTSQNLDENDGYDNKVFPGGFQKATLREFNDPNVCIYIPNAAGKVIELKVESEEAGDRLCIGDLHDESTDRNNPGQNDACSDTSVKTCFGDANVGSTENDKIGYPFYIFCDEGCQEGGGSGDVSLWLRARFSDTTWLDGTYLATENVEMWCEYVVRDYPAFDVYPSDLSIQTPPLVFDDEDSTSQLLVALTLVLMFIWY